jgi:hypothetical protein
MDKDLKKGRIVWVSLLAIIVILILVRIFSASGNPTTASVQNEVKGDNPTPYPSIPPEKTLQNDYHTFQTFNNCAPAALSMALSYYGVHVSQETLADSLRPYHNSIGDNDDKSTPPPELAREAEKYGLVSYFRADGDIDLLKQFIAHDIPVVVRALFKPDEDYAHYRVIKGYDDGTQEIIEDDGYDGKNIRFSYQEFKQMWQPYNYAYLVMVRPENKKVVEDIIGDELDPKVAWQHAASTARAELAADPSDIEAQFNLSMALYYMGDNEGAIKEYEKVEPRLGQHVIWYQIEPIQAYFNVGNYAKVNSLIDSILNNKNRAFTELYILRGKIYEKQGNLAKAKEAFQNAVMYNRNSIEAKEALASVKN